ncbi:30S ribosomal protein S6--L-glutamate ligase [bacterium]|nr:30S ribosomal protein S6--L-glutamate ligase [bacterium]
MKVVILSRRRSLYSTKRLVEAATARGHNVQVIDPLRLAISLSRRNPKLYYGGRVLKNVDAVIPRIGASITAYGLAVLRQFEMAGTFPLNESQAIARSRDKLRCLQILSREEVGMPETAYARQPGDIAKVLEVVGGAPVVIKLLEGTQGKGVVLAETNQAASSVIEAFHDLDQNILVQRFIKESSGRDVRAFVVGRRVVAAMERRNSTPGEFRSNLHRGGEGFPIKLSREYRQTAIRAASALGLDVAGVDMLISNEGPMIMEVNSSPGLEGIEGASGVDVATSIIRHMERILGRRHARNKIGA